MKKLLVVLLSLGLIMAFSMTAWAGAPAGGPTIKFSGQYYASGVYDDNTQLVDFGKYSSAAVFQRFRLRSELGIADGLAFIFRMDVQEKQWGQTDWRNGIKASGQDNTNSRDMKDNGISSKIQENIEMEQGYVRFTTKAGVFNIGYQPAFSWGLDFMNSGSTTAPRAAFNTQLGPVNVGLIWDKYFEPDTSGVDVPAAKFYQNKADADDDRYSVTGIYKWKGGDAGLMLSYFLLDSKKPEAVGGYRSKYWYISPYFRTTVGPFYFEGELETFRGKWREYEPLMNKTDVDINTLAFYLMGRYNFGPGYVGAQYAYTSGDDYADPTKITRTQLSKSSSWNPCLILQNNDESSWHPARWNWDSSGKGNLIIYQIFGGFSPMPRLDLFASLSYATVADKHSAAGKEAADSELGKEFDITATYKIFDQLTYMVGFGYLWTGDNWGSANAESAPPVVLGIQTKGVSNDYLLVNKLDLVF